MLIIYMLVVYYIYDILMSLYIIMCLIICDVKILLYLLCVVYTVYQNGDTPLMISVKKGNMEICKLLMNHGALPYINTPDKVNI